MVAVAGPNLAWTLEHLTKKLSLGRVCCSMLNGGFWLKSNTYTVSQQVRVSDTASLKLLSSTSIHFSPTHKSRDKSQVNPFFTSLGMSLYYMYRQTVYLRFFSDSVFKLNCSIAIRSFSCAHQQRSCNNAR